jgi:prolyl-tRNA synthetase
VRFSQSFIPTLRDDPADAEVVSHRLMLRAGMIRKVAAGIYTYLPLAWRSLRKVEAIVRAEMDAAGAQELRMPGVQPAELWHESGRWDLYGRELLRMKDRHERDFCLGPTHEEVITDLVRGEVRSYKQLPLNLYQMQTKFRDEIRPRFGLMRGREFIMKDGYSFDADESAAEVTYRRMEAAYHRIFGRMGLNFRAVEADTGQIGGSFSHEFMVLADTGEDDVVFCDACDYAANREKATSRVAAPGARETPTVEQVPTPGIHSVADVAEFLKQGPERFIKAILFRVGVSPEPGKNASQFEHTYEGWPSQLVMVLIRGDLEVNEVKLLNHLKVPDLRLATDDEIARATGGPLGFSGPVGLPKGARIVVDSSVAGLTDAVAGANAADMHLIHVQPGRDFPLGETVDLDSARAGDGCPRCDGGVLAIRRGIEVGHIFMLGTKYSDGMGATFLDPDGKAKPFVMGCYGIGVGRTLAAAIEQNHDEKGIVWPMPIAPLHAALVVMNMKSEPLVAAAEALYEALTAAGVEVLLDDRPERAGVKLTDAELLGLPILLLLGDRGLAKGTVEVRARAGGETREVPLDEAAAAVRALVEAAGGPGAIG